MKVLESILDEYYTSTVPGLLGVAADYLADRLGYAATPEAVSFLSRCDRKPGRVRGLDGPAWSLGCHCRVRQLLGSCAAEDIYNRNSHTLQKYVVGIEVFFALPDARVEVIDTSRYNYGHYALYDSVESALVSLIRAVDIAHSRQ